MTASFDGNSVADNPIGGSGLPGAQAHRDASPTETAARERIAPNAAKLAGRVLGLVVACGSEGLTATEAYDLYCKAFGEPRGGLYSIAPRLSALERSGYLQASGQVRDRRQAYTATADGRAWAAAQLASAGAR